MSNNEDCLDFTSEERENTMQWCTRRTSRVLNSFLTWLGFWFCCCWWPSFLPGVLFVLTATLFLFFILGDRCRSSKSEYLEPLNKRREPRPTSFPVVSSPSLCWCWSSSLIFSPYSSVSWNRSVRRIHIVVDRSAHSERNALQCPSVVPGVLWSKPPERCSSNRADCRFLGITDWRSSRHRRGCSTRSSRVSSSDLDRLREISENRRRRKSLTESGQECEWSIAARHRLDRYSTRRRGQSVAAWEREESARSWCHSSSDTGDTWRWYGPDSAPLRFSFVHRNCKQCAWLVKPEECWSRRRWERCYYRSERRLGTYPRLRWQTSWAIGCWSDWTRNTTDPTGTVWRWPSRGSSPTRRRKERVSGDTAYRKIERDREDPSIHSHDWTFSHRVDSDLEKTIRSPSPVRLFSPWVDACPISATCRRRSERKISIAPKTPRAFSLCGWIRHLVTNMFKSL